MPDFLADALTWPHNYQYALALETAKEWKVPPTSLMLMERQPTEPWTIYDKKLAIAWTILQKETCTHCGQPLWICRSSDRNLDFSIRKDICYAEKKLEEFRDSTAGKNLKKGQYPYAVPVMMNGGAFPTREAYINELNDEE